MLRVREQASDSTLALAKVYFDLSRPLRAVFLSNFNNGNTLAQSYIHLMLTGLQTPGEPAKDAKKGNMGQEGGRASFNMSINQGHLAGSGH